MKSYLPLPIALFCASTFAFASGNDSPDHPEPPKEKQTAPVARWSFDASQTDLGKPEGAVALGQDGPAPATFKAFSATNRAARFGGEQPGVIRVADSGKDSAFDFDQGDAITIEAWVNPSAPARGANMYIIGKGRTHNAGQVKDNHNYALRLWEGDGVLRLSFVFRSRKDGAHAGDWHRWTTTSGFAPDSGWHHVAVSYVFGKPETIHGYVDGESLGGKWDMGGATKQAPVVDDDEIWLGSAMNKLPNSSFRGLMDEVVLYRGVLPEATIAARYPVPAYTPALPVDGLPEGKVRVEIVENIGKSAKWPRTFPKPSDIYDEDVFGFFQIAQKYTDSGVRTDRSNPYLLRAMSKITIPHGKQQILVRSRGLGRLWMDGKVIGQIAFGNTGGGAHNEVEKDTAAVEAPNLRLLGPGDRELLIPIEGDGGAHTFVFEMIAGNGKVRTTIGETSVSLQQKDGSYALLSPSTRVVPLSDVGWLDYRNERLDFYTKLDAQKRVALKSRENEYWQSRHSHAQQWIAAKAARKEASIDGLLSASWTKADSANQPVAGGIDFATQIKPILADNCYRCHEEKSKGGLRLNTREAAMKGGDSEKPAIVPGKPEESQIIALTHPDAGEEIMPPKGDPLSAETRQLLSEWIKQGASYATAGKKVEPAPLTDDLDFLRRLTLDTVGVLPSAKEIALFTADAPSTRRTQAIDRLLADGRWADHWTSYWQDVLAENPNMLKPSLNNSGPFRYWIHEALSDNVPMDRFVTELVMMEGAVMGGGPGGFAMAAENDAPMAAKAHILSTAFLGVEMTCARCHDSPYHQSKQRDLFEMAAMLNRKELKLPVTSTVPMSTFGGRKPLIKITLKPGEIIAPSWPQLFAGSFAGEVETSLLKKAGDSREKLAALITAPRNTRFPQVIVNRMWKQLMGRGFVEPVDDWEASKPTHPELLQWLADDFVAHGYDMKHLQRRILQSQAYQRQARPATPGVTPDFSAPIQRRMTAEQIVDSLFASVGKRLDSEELSMDIDGTQSQSAMISLGIPRRAWEFTSLSNERDRPSLAIPKAQAIVDVLENFGWRSSRQDPKSVRENAANVRQPAVLANGPLGRWVTTLSENSDITALSLRADLSLDQVIDEVFLRLLTRHPTDGEKETYRGLLGDGFTTRIIPLGERPPPIQRPPLKYVSWSNHLSEEANSIKIEMEKRAREGDPPTVALNADWRERMEDMVWALINSPEFIHLP